MKRKKKLKTKAANRRIKIGIRQMSPRPQIIDFQENVSEALPEDSSSIFNETRRNVEEKIEAFEEGVGSDFNELEEPKRPFFGSLFKSLSIFFTLVSVAAILLGAYLLFLYKTSSKDILIKIKAPSQVFIGAPFDMEVQVKNSSDESLTNAKLFLDLPENFLLMKVDGKPDDLAEKKGISIEEFKSGESQKKVFALIPTFKGSSDVKKYKIASRLSYDLGRNSNFEVRADDEITLSEPAVNLDVEQASTVISGSAFSFKLKYKNISNFNFSDFNIGVKYPDNFRFISANLQPNSLNNYWELGGLRPGSDGFLEIQGSLSGAEGREFIFPVTFFSSFDGKDFPIYTEIVKETIAPSPLGLEVYVNGSENYIASLNDDLRYVIKYKNMSGVVLQNASITATLRGVMVDFSSIKTNGVLDMTRGAVRWTANELPELGLLQPGTSGEASFNIKLPNKYPINRFGDKNFSIQVKVGMTSPSVPFYLSGEALGAEKDVQTKIGGMITMDARAFYRDPNSGIVNTGEFPPKVGAPTQYAIHWILRNFSTDASTVRVSVILQTGVSWKGGMISNAETAPKYDETAREVSWEISKIQATRGAVGEPITAVFQIEAVPDISQVGNFQSLLGATSLKANDDFTGEVLTAIDLPLSTNLVDDATVETGKGIVVQ